jgi:two-component system, NtrC family, sensor kinase
LRIRFLILSLTLTALISLVLLIWLPGHVEEQQKDELTRRAKLGAEVLDKAAIGALTVGDRGALNQLARGFIRSKDFLYIMILDKDGKPLADSGLEREETLGLERELPELLRSDVDAQSETRWASTGERVINISRPVFYEQLRIGTIVLGISARRVSLQTTLLRNQLVLLCVATLIAGIGLAFYLSHSLSLALRKIAAGLETLPDKELERQAGKIKEFNFLVENLLKQKNLVKSSASELESQKQQLEAEMAHSRQEITDLRLRLSSANRQVEALQDKVRLVQEQSRHLTKILPLVEFAAGVAPEIDGSMRQIGQSAERLSEDLGRVRNLIDLYDKAMPQTPEDLEVIRQYRSFIQYDKIKEAMDELIATITGGAGWIEQLTDLLKQLSNGQMTQPK